MPMYEYQCTKCKTTVELYRLLSDKNRPRCTKCDKLLTKQMSSGIMDLKGKGFYKSGVS